MDSITFTLTSEEAKGILQVLGDLPSRSGAFPLMVRLQQQFESQSQPKAPEAPPAE